jgi:hypothetical protein
MKNIKIRFWIFVGTLLVLGISAVAQERGGITGTITDSTGASLAHASVKVTNLARGETVSLESTTTGQYTASNLIPGTYQVRVEAPGFNASVLTGVDVKVAEVTRVDVQVKVGNVAETVTVSSEAALLKTESSDVGTSVESAMISTLPLQVAGAVRDPLAFAKLTPGFNGQTANSAREFQTYYTVNGGQSGATQILVDGADVELTSVQSQFNTGVSVDAVEEFKVMSSNFSAEYGRSTGGIINLSLKSGTNQFHGTGYDYLRNDVFDAKGFFSPERQLNRQNDFGATFSGPVWIPKVYNGHDKTFFFFSYEGFRFRQGATNQLTTLPIAVFRTGDFSRLVDADGHQIPIYDPNTTVVLGDGTVQRQQFPGNIIPANRIDSIAQQIVADMPGTAFDRLSNNAFDDIQNVFGTGIKTIKVDHSLTARQKITGTYSQADEDDVTHYWAGAQDYGILQHTKYARLAHDFVISPTVLNHIQVGFSRRWRREGALPSALDSVRLPDGDCHPIAGATGYDLGVVSNAGGGCAGFNGIDTSLQLTEALSVSKGRHSLKFGGEMRKQHWDVTNTFDTEYSLSFTPEITGLPGSSATTGDGFASFLLGEATSGNWSDQGNLSRHRFSAMGLYAQDDIKVSRKLTVNAGLRYDLFWPLSDAQGRISAFDPNTPNPGADNIPGAIIFGGSGDGRTGSNRFQELYKHAFGPRLGFAYGLNERTVVRAAYGIYYQELKEPGWGGANDGFFTQRSFSTADGFTPALKMSDGLTMNFPVGSTIDPTLLNGQSVNYADSDSGRPPISQNWQVSIQRQLSQKLVVDVAYVGTKGNHLIASNRIFNQVDPKYLSLGSLLDADIDSPAAVTAGIAKPYPSFTGTVAQALRPFPQYQSISTANLFGADKSGNSTYHALQVKLQGHIAQGLDLTVAYAFSKNLTDNSNNRDLDTNARNSYSAQNGFDPAAEKTYASMDIPHNLSVGYVYTLPVGHGQKYVTSGVADKIIGGWALSGVLTYQSGLMIATPFPASSHVPLFAGSIRPDRVTDVPLLTSAASSGHFDPNTDAYLNAAAWASPAPFSFGDARGMSGVRVPKFLNEDLSLSKNIPIYERFHAEFRADAFNVFNRTVFGFPTLDLSSSGFGMITSQRNSPRTMQVGLKLSF